MTSFLRYIAKYKDITLSEKPFGIVDALVLTALAYLPYPYEEKFNVNDDIIVNDLINDYLKQENKANTTFTRKLDLEFAQLIKDSKRFSTLRMVWYVRRNSVSEEKQFTALSFLYNDKIFVSYMGTDTSLVGWKEDLNLSFQSATAGQLSAVKYLKEIARTYPNKEIILSGHSKGGNFAMYAGTFIDRETQNRIKYIFNFDGPGFTKEIIKSREYHYIRKKIITVVPSYSLVGMIFEKSDRFLIVESKGTRFASHLYYFWVVEDDDFKYVKKISYFSLRTHFTIHYVMESLDKEEREIFVKRVYDALLSSGETTVFGVFRRIPKIIEYSINSFYHLAEREKHIIKKAIKSIFVGATRYSKEVAIFKKISSKWMEEDK